MNPRIVRLTAGIDEFKGYWRGFKNLSPERLRSLRRLATIESIGSSTRIEGAGLNDQEVAAIIEDLDAKSFRTRDEQEVAGCKDYGTDPGISRPDRSDGKSYPATAQGTSPFF